MTTTEPKHNFVELVLTCGSWQEAQNIADHLLDKRLIACAKFLPIESKYWWEGELNTAKEVMVLMESVEHFFGKVESEIAGLHSYKTFVLKSLLLGEISLAASDWLNETLRGQEA